MTDLIKGKPLYTLKGHEGAVNAVEFSQSGDYFATSGDDRIVMVWKMKSNSF